MAKLSIYDMQKKQLIKLGREITLQSGRVYSPKQRDPKKAEILKRFEDARGGIKIGTI